MDQKINIDIVKSNNFKLDSSLLSYVKSINSIDQAESLISDAIKLSASDIHIQPSGFGAEIRFRIKGSMSLGESINRDQYLELIGRLKILSQMRIDIKDIPQDGSFGYSNYRIRTSTIPGVDGECMVLRVLDSAILKIKYLTDTGMSVDVFERLMTAINISPGLIVFSGPTGSGKSTSAYSLLTSLVENNRQILTIEDPVEKRIEGIKQVQIKPQSGFNYSQALKASMRQDPDVIYVGEIRDSDTMKSVMSLALTGHTVITTIHARDVKMAIRRCCYLGADVYELSMVMRAFFNQRLESVPAGLIWEFDQFAVFESLINDKNGDLQNIFMDSDISGLENSIYKDDFFYKTINESREMYLKNEKH